MTIIKQRKTELAVITAASTVSSSSPNTKKGTTEDNSNSSTFVVPSNNTKQLTNTNNKTTKQTKVTFASSTTTKPTISRNDYTQQEYENCYYSYNEMKQMKYERHQTVKWMNSQKTPSNQYCTRGLEHKTKQGMRVRQFNMIESMMAVFDEQENMNSTIESIANVYSSCTVQCQAQAFEKGLRDSMVVYEYYDRDCDHDHGSCGTIEEEQKDGSARNKQQQQRRRLSNAAA
mmetsp:Transcript_5038/g.14722  ORF Transcript_5038/g.14722 Transcript_5038/m.14722 type:complete len:231 (-) Transcript_5038:92-784(-)|eukprot:CAMPEP_0119558456 /NCGR_PEP_ID=MMETSP1352-20130426/10802_1 /TAXON_ID=265584 /ORGANISM="Stauroneis constricta, Strain CCMP1120" /LENGTH=230 /DNA_ID=CAMNT_0007605825 /DNA_START=344 /DNA_END=1036 /DNA_ORIENTATION=+